MWRKQQAPGVNCRGLALRVLWYAGSYVLVVMGIFLMERKVMLAS